MKIYNYMAAALAFVTCIAIVIRCYEIWYGFLVLTLLFIPMFDRQWNMQGVLMLNKNTVYTSISVLLVLLATIIAVSASSIEVLIRTFFFAAVPEEWFFRVYLMTMLGGGYKANVVSSFVFSLLHGITRGWFVGLLVFIPSLAFGLLYQKTRSYYVVTATHAISNIIYIVYISQFFKKL